MAKLDLEWLMVFDEVYKTASVSKAAERLGLPQSAASHALIKLRAHFGDRLFSRTSRGMLPTPQAQAIQPALRAALASLELARTKRSGFHPADARRTFQISMTDISEIVLVPTLLNHLRKVAPFVQLEIEKTSVDSVRRLQDGEVDLAVGFLPHLDAGFYQQVLFAQHFVCIASSSHPRIGARISKSAYLRESHVIVSASGTGHGIVDKMLERDHVDRTVALRVPSFLGVARIVAETELIATVPLRYAEVVAIREAVRILPVPYPLPRYNVKQHWHERFHDDPGNAWMRRTIAELLGDQSDRGAADGKS